MKADETMQEHRKWCVYKTLGMIFSLSEINQLYKLIVKNE